MFLSAIVSLKVALVVLVIRYIIFAMIKFYKNYKMRKYIAFHETGHAIVARLFTARCQFDGITDLNTIEFISIDSNTINKRYPDSFSKMDGGLVKHIHYDAFHKKKKLLRLSDFNNSMLQGAVLQHIDNNLLVTLAARCVETKLRYGLRYVTRNAGNFYKNESLVFTIDESINERNIEEITWNMDDQLSDRISYEKGARIVASSLEIAVDDVISSAYFFVFNYINDPRVWKMIQRLSYKLLYIYFFKEKKYMDGEEIEAYFKKMKFDKFIDEHYDSFAHSRYPLSKEKLINFR